MQILEQIKLTTGICIFFSFYLFFQISEDIYVDENMPLDLPFSKLFLSNLLSLIKWSRVNFQPKLNQLFDVCVKILRRIQLLISA